MSAGLTILCYHRVLPESERTGDARPYFVRGTAISIATFRSQLESLARRFEFVGEAQVIAWLAGERSFARPACWLTFDDGYADVIEHALPILKLLGVPATVFIATDVLLGKALRADRWYAVLNSATRTRGELDGGSLRWRFDLDDPDDYARLIDGPEKRGFLGSTGAESEAMLARLVAAVGAAAPASLEGLYLGPNDVPHLTNGGWSVGSHTRSHPFLPLLTDEALDAELRGSRAALASLGIEARALAYPDGRWTRELLPRVRSAGYSLAVTLDPGPVRVEHEPLALTRMLAGETLR